MARIEYVGRPRYAAETCTCYETLKEATGELVRYGTHGIKELEKNRCYQCERCGTEYHQAPLPVPISRAPDEETVNEMEQRVLDLEGGFDLLWEFIVDNYWVPPPERQKTV